MDKHAYKIKRFLMCHTPSDIGKLSFTELEVLSIDILGYCAAYPLTNKEVLNLKRIISSMPKEIAEDMINDILMDSGDIFNGLAKNKEMRSLLFSLGLGTSSKRITTH